MEHFSHDHELTLIEDPKDDDGMKPICHGCELPISGQSYSCLRLKCMFFLHKTCAELPSELRLPAHPQHALSLLPNPPSCYNYCICDICRGNCNRFVYHCSQCGFDVDIKCASVILAFEHRFKHISHQHQLISLLKSSTFLCDACGLIHKGPSYLCTTCGYWIHQECASVPTSIQIRNHRHLLTLVYSLPTDTYYNLQPDCATCDQMMKRIYWTYWCAECAESGFYVHVSCATSETKNSEDGRDLEALKCTYKGNSGFQDDIGAYFLPVADETINPHLQFIKDVVEEQRSSTATTETGGIIHNHPLYLFDNQIDRSLQEICNGCAQTISAPFYNCAHCNFFLHKQCAELPTQLRHPCHPKHFLFLLTPESTNCHMYRCRSCDLLCNTFIFGCHECDFYLDSKCATLPRMIRHEVDEHCLSLKPTWSGMCRACLKDSHFVFFCWHCKLNLCVRCALLPKKIQHRYDEHPFILTYSFVPDDLDISAKKFCEICEEDIDYNYWFYHCLECDQSMHVNCLLPITTDSNIKYGVKYPAAPYY